MPQQDSVSASRSTMTSCWAVTLSRWWSWISNCGLFIYRTCRLLLMMAVGWPSFAPLKWWHHPRGGLGRCASTGSRPSWLGGRPCGWCGWCHTERGRHASHVCPDGHNAPGHPRDASHLRRAPCRWRIIPEPSPEGFCQGILLLPARGPARREISPSPAGRRPPLRRYALPARQWR